ncbi:MAG TPA: helix-turn-helix transcriptional regulator [Candidatus Acidoferrum sp.]
MRTICGRHIYGDKSGGGLEERERRAPDFVPVGGPTAAWYEIGKLIEMRSGGTLHFHVASLYPLLYRLEKREWIQGRWVEKPNQRRRRYYRLTAEGQRVLALERKKWQEFAGAVGRIAGVQHA